MADDRHPQQPSQTDPTRQPSGEIRMPAWLFYPTLIITLAVVLLLVRRGDPVAAISVVAIAMFAWIGFGMGLVRITASILAITAALWYAPTLGMRYESQVSNAIGTTGLTNRFLCIAVIALVIASVVTILVTWICNRLIGKRRRVNMINSYGGFVFGFTEGILIVWLILGFLLSMQIWQRGQDIETNRAAKLIDHWAATTRQSSVGPFIRDNNPFDKIAVLASLGELHSTVRQFSSPQTVKKLLSNPKIQELKSDPEVASLLEKVRQDPTVKELIAKGRPPTRQDLIELMSSPSIMQLMDEPGFLENARAVIQEMRDAQE